MKFHPLVHEVAIQSLLVMGLPIANPLGVFTALIFLARISLAIR